MLNCLKALNERKDGPLHVLKVVEKLADPRQYRDDHHERIIEGLNRVLRHHALAVNSANKVVFCSEHTPTTPPDMTLSESQKAEILNRLTFEIFNALTMHPKIKEVSQGLYEDKHYSQAIFEAFKAVNNAVKSKSGLTDKDGQDLMAHAFSGDPPPLAFNKLRTQSEKNEQEGFKFLFMGAMTGIRNPKAHDNLKQTDPCRAHYYLGFASLLMTRLDECITSKRKL